MSWPPPLEQASGRLSSASHAAEFSRESASVLSRDDFRRHRTPRMASDDVMKPSVVMSLEQICLRATPHSKYRHHLAVSAEIGMISSRLGFMWRLECGSRRLLSRDYFAHAIRNAGAYAQHALLGICHASSACPAKCASQSAIDIRLTSIARRRLCSSGR